MGNLLQKTLNSVNKQPDAGEGIVCNVMHGTLAMHRVLSIMARANRAVEIVSTLQLLYSSKRCSRSCYP